MVNVNHLSKQYGSQPRYFAILVEIRWSYLERVMFYGGSKLKMG